MNRNNIYWPAPPSSLEQGKEVNFRHAQVLMPILTENGKLRFQYFDIWEMNDDTCGINNNKTQTNITPHMTDSQECLDRPDWLDRLEVFFTVIFEENATKSRASMKQNGYLNDLVMANVNDSGDRIR